jgi:HAD superfamily phosphoserine phosphatase-like hydrolase
MLKKENIVVFDFDGTLSAHDSNMEFGKYCFRHSVRPWLFLPLILTAFVMREFNHGGVAWREMMRRFLTADMVKRFAPDFIRAHKRERFGWAAERVAAERAAGNRVLLISAGPDYLIPKLVSDMKFDVVMCSKMDTARPWKYKYLCHGQNKVWAMDEWAREHKLIPNVVRSYSDHKSDKPMMELADEGVWINPKTGMRI